MSGKGERGGTEGQDVTRRNATGRRLNPFEEQRGRVSENRSRLFRPTLPPPSFRTGFNRRPVALRRVTSCPSVAPLSPFPDLSSFSANNRLFRPTTVSKNPPILFPPCARTRFSPSPHPAGSTSYLLLPSLPSSPRWSSLLLHPGCPSRPFCPVSLEPPGTLWVSPPCLLNRPFCTCRQRLGYLFLVRGSEHRVFVLRPSLLRRFLCSVFLLYCQRPQVCD